MEIGHDEVTLVFRTGARGIVPGIQPLLVSLGVEPHYQDPNVERPRNPGLTHAGRFAECQNINNKTTFC